MTPEIGERLIDQVRPAALDAHACVQNQDRAGLTLLRGRLGITEMWALVILLADCADPARLRIACGRCRNPRCGKPLEPRAGQTIADGAKGYCRPCYDRWRKASRPETGPPERKKPAREASARYMREQQASRMEEFGFFRSLGDSVEDAGKCAGVRLRTAWQYEAARLRELEDDDAAA